MAKFHIRLSLGVEEGQSPYSGGGMKIANKRGVTKKGFLCIMISVVCTGGPSNLFADEEAIETR